MAGGTASQDEVITLSDTDDETTMPSSPSKELSGEQLDIDIEVRRGTIIKKVDHFKMIQELGQDEDQDGEHFVNADITCLFKSVVNKGTICDGSHEKKADVVRCVSIALKYYPFKCWFCHKKGKNVGFPLKSDLVEHQEEEMHDDDIERHDNCHVWIEEQNQLYNSYIASYISKRLQADPKPIAPSKFIALMTDGKVDDQSKQKKRRLFTDQFGYAPFTCILCDEMTKATKKVHMFRMGTMNAPSRQAATRHLQRCHSISYGRCPDVKYWFKKNFEIKQLEEIFTKYLTKPVPEPCHAVDGDHNHDKSDEVPMTNGGEVPMANGDESDKEDDSIGIIIKEKITAKEFRHEDLFGEMYVPVSEVGSLPDDSPRSTPSKEPSLPLDEFNENYHEPSTVDKLIVIHDKLETLAQDIAKEEAIKDQVAKKNVKQRKVVKKFMCSICSCPIQPTALPDHFSKSHPDSVPTMVKMTAK